MQQRNKSDPRHSLLLDPRKRLRFATILSFSSGRQAGPPAVSRLFSLVSSLVFSRSHLSGPVVEDADVGDERGGEEAVSDERLQLLGEALGRQAPAVSLLLQVPQQRFSARNLRTNGNGNGNGNTPERRAAGDQQLAGGRRYAHVRRACNSA